MATQDGQAHSRSIGTVVPCAMPNDQPRTAAATAARRAGRLEKMATELRLAGWTVTAPEGTTEFQCCTCGCTYPSTSRAYFGRVPPREGQHKPVGSICRYCAIDPTISMDWEAAL